MVIQYILCALSVIASSSAQDLPPPPSQPLPVTFRIPVPTIPAVSAGVCPSEAQLAGARQAVRQAVFGINCDCGDSTWTRVAFLNRSDPTQVCPGDLTTYTSPVRACGRGPLGNSANCVGTTYPAPRIYSRVCGRIIAYQSAHTIGFNRLRNLNESLEGPYVTGVSLTHGRVGSRQHIWTFASALGEVGDFNPDHLCPCSNSGVPPLSSAFLGNDYFCDSGNHGTAGSATDFYPSDPLWDGKGCGSESSCCQFNNPPYFCKLLPSPTADDLEVRVCHAGAGMREDTPIQLMEIFVK